MEADEMRLGLQGRVRWVWASRGVKVVQKLQFVFEWVYLLLAVHPPSGQIKWQWIERMRQEDLIPVLNQWQLDAIIWDGAPSHRGSQVAQLPGRRIFQPSYSPEVNPVERLFEAIRQEVEGPVYESLQAKKEAVEKVLHQWAVDPGQVRSLAGWAWICGALDSLPAQ